MTRIDLDKSCGKYKVPVRDQGKEGACTGYGLATVIHYLMRARKVVPDKTEVSPKMLYVLAKRYDEWPGEEYEGSSPRSAMKGWHKHGIAAQTLWNKHNNITPSVAEDAAKRPLGTYYRVNHKDLVAMHSAIAEVGVLYASATVHAGWDNVKSDGIIEKKMKYSAGMRLPSSPMITKGSGSKIPGGQSGGKRVLRKSAMMIGLLTARMYG